MKHLVVIKGTKTGFAVILVDIQRLLISHKLTILQDKIRHSTHPTSIEVSFNIDCKASQISAQEVYLAAYNRLFGDCNRGII